MVDLVPAPEFALVARESATADQIRSFHRFVSQREQDLGQTGSETSYSDRLGTAEAIERSLPGELISLYSYLEEEFLAQVEPATITEILVPADAGFVRVFDEERLIALHDCFEAQRESYLSAHYDRTRFTRRPPVDRRVIKPEVRFELTYLAPVEFARQHDDRGIRWEFIAADDLLYTRWPMD